MKRRSRVEFGVKKSIRKEFREYIHSENIGRQDKEVSCIQSYIYIRVNTLINWLQTEGMIIRGSHILWWQWNVTKVLNRVTEWVSSGNYVMYKQLTYF